MPDRFAIARRPGPQAAPEDAGGGAGQTFGGVTGTCARRSRGIELRMTALGSGRCRPIPAAGKPNGWRWREPR